MASLETSLVSSFSSSSSSIDTSLLYKEKQAIKVTLEMLIDREYKIDYSDNNFTNEQPYIIKATKSNNIIIVFINEDDKLNIQGIKDKISIMNKENATSCIIIYKSSVTSSAKKSLETLEYEFELFALHELQLNITRHRLVPRHTRVISSEKEELDKNYKGKLPIILHTDPISRYYSFKRGEYIRITRKDGSIIYRIVK
jgi:DNA-directed RNA polymerase I, II, and III subunit RPABC1